MLRRGGVVAAVGCCFYRCMSMVTLHLRNEMRAQADACKWSTLRIPGDSLCLSAHTGACARRGRMNLACRHTLALAAFAQRRTKRQNKTLYSGFGGALAYGYGFRITRSAFGIVAVFGAQNSFCHLGVP